MSIPFTAELRTRPGVIGVGEPGTRSVSIRVQMPEVWDTVRVDAPPTATVREVKLAALDALLPAHDDHDAFVMKLHGWEVLDESASLAGAGAVDGSIFLLTNRRRQPVR
ncbi:MAG: hypothetical protein ACRENI_07550 [Gemmatimonadaceae bacterium]